MSISNEYTAIHYHDYLALDEILGAQRLRSEAAGVPAHDEHLFIIIHQVYELWFKEMIHNLESVILLFASERVDETNFGTVTSRCNRIIEILQLLVQQIRVLETMTPLDFLEFRNYLFPASGFQSFQFRKFEALLGLGADRRMTYNNVSFTSPFSPEKAAELARIDNEWNLFLGLQSWLERTPFITQKSWDFVGAYQQSVVRMLHEEKQRIQDHPQLSAEEKVGRLKMMGGMDSYYDIIFQPEISDQLRKEGKSRLSYRALLGALFIQLYRDEPILQQPSLLLRQITEIDEWVTIWRYRHAQMVLRMLGKKIGTGGSSGYDYLLDTAVKHQIYMDLHNISTLMIPRSHLPVIPEEIRQQMKFHYSA